MDVVARTQTITIMFCDLVASTERRARLGDDAFDEFAGRLLATLRNAISDAWGRETSNAGDGLMVVFAESAANAVACATAMHRAVLELDLDDPPRLRVGISSGEVAQLGDEFSGMPIVEAARLQAAAAPGQTLVNAVVRALLGTRGGFRFRDVGSLTLKGLPAPLPAVEVISDNSAAPELHPRSEPGTIRRASVSRPSRAIESGDPRSTQKVAVLFAEMVDSELAPHLSPDPIDDLPRGYISILRRAIAEAGGSEVQSQDGTLMVVFSSALSAMECAVTMQQGVDHHNRGREHSVDLRVGLSGGDITQENGEYFGDPVSEAAHLCAVSESGQVLATDVVLGMAGRRNRRQCRSLGALTLEGLPDPVETLEVLWDPLAGFESNSFIPLPGRLAVRPGVGVVGRTTELEVIADAFRRASTGEGRHVLLVSGEAGLGKTALVAEAARAAFEDGACVLFGHCEENLATPYQLFSEALDHYVTHAPEDQLLAHIETHGSELTPLVSALRNRIPDLPPSKANDSDSERFLLFAAVVGLLATVSEHQPIVLVLEDLQWADSGSLLLLRHLNAAEQDMRVLILCTYRDNELAHSDALRETLGALRRHDGVSRIDLAGLDDIGVVSFLEATAGEVLDDVGMGLARAVYRETDGNPFFVGEVLRHLSEIGAISRHASGRWMAEESLEHITLPDSVREVIGGRVVRLGKDAERALSMASVIGRDFDLDLLARSTKTSEDELLDILDAAASVDLVRELPDTGRYNFAHALVQHTLYEDLGFNRRARAHRQVAEALEDLCGDRPGARLGELARHWMNATQPIDLVKAISYSRQAGDAALSALAPADALRYYAQALDLCAQADDSDPVLALDLSIGLGSAQRQIGDPKFRETLLETAHRAAEFGDTQRLVTSALVNDRGFRVLGSTDGDKIEVLEMALARLPGDHPDRALLLAILCEELPGECPLERRRALSDEALAIAEASGDHATIVRVLIRVSLPLRVPSLLHQSLSRSADALARAERVGDPVLLFEAAAVRSVTAVQAGEIVEVDRSIEIARSMASRLSQPTISWIHVVERATRSLIAGDIERAEELASEALKIGTESGQPDATLLFGAQYFGVSWQRGTLADLVPLIEQTIAENPGFETLLAGLALAHVEGDHSNDASQFLVNVAYSEPDVPSTGAWLTNRTLYAEVAIERRDAVTAERQFERLAPWASQFSAGALSAEGPVSHYLGGLATVLNRYDEAEAYFVQSATMCDKVGGKFFAARTDLSWGRMLAERRVLRDAEKARHLLTKAHTVAVANGYRTVERRAAEALELLD
jgi:class 3 adenylate cyclase